MSEAPVRKLQVKSVPLDDLVPLASNVRSHDARNIATIKASLSRFGQVAPLVVREGSNEIVGGNGTLQAMRELGWDRCRVVHVALDSDSDMNALAAVLNRSTDLSSFDPKGLAELLDSLQSEGWPVDDLGWTDQEIAALWQGALQPEESPLPEEEGQGSDGEGELGRPIYLTASQREAFDNAVKRFREELGEASEGNIVSLLSLNFLSCDIAQFK